MIGCITQTADGQPVHALQKGAKPRADGRPVQPDPKDDEQLTPAHEMARAFMRSLVEDGEDQDHDDEDETQDRADTDLDKTGRVLPEPADGPGGPVDGGPFPRSLSGRHSRTSVGGVSVERMDLQQLGPRRLADLRTAGPDASGSSVHSDPGQVRVQVQDQAAASASTPLPGSPSASPKRHDFGPAPSGHRQRFGKTPSRPAESGS